MKNIANETRTTVFKVSKMMYPKQQYAEKILGTKICKIWKHHPERQFGCLEEQIANFEERNDPKWQLAKSCAERHFTKKSWMGREIDKNVQKGFITTIF